MSAKEKPETKRLPMMPIRDVVIFPHMMTPFVVGRESSVRALEEALAGEKKIFLATQHDASIDEPRPDEIFTVGTASATCSGTKCAAFVPSAIWRQPFFIAWADCHWPDRWKIFRPGPRTRH